MAEIDQKGKIYHFLLFTATVTQNKIKVFGCSEGFRPEQKVTVICRSKGYGGPTKSVFVTVCNFVVNVLD